MRHGGRYRDVSAVTPPDYEPRDFRVETAPYPEAIALWNATDSPPQWEYQTCDLSMAWGDFYTNIIPGDLRDWEWQSCISEEQSGFSRIRALDAVGNPLTDWVESEQWEWP